VRQPDGGTEQIDDATEGPEGKATEGPGPRTEEWRWPGKLVGEGSGLRIGEHLAARQGRLGTRMLNRLRP